MKKTLAFLMLLVAAVLNSCGGPSGDDDVVTIKTQYGDMTVLLYDETPKHKENFLKLVNEKFYDSLLFHRVIEGFMIQGGDPDSKKAAEGQPLGQGGPGYTIPAEINPNFYHEKGALAAARLGDQMNPEKESSGSQFYIVQGKVVPELQLKVDQQKMQAGLQQMYQTGKYQAVFDSLDAVYQRGNPEEYEAKVANLVPEVEKATGIKVTIDVPEDKLKAYTTVGGVPFLDNQYTVFGKVIKGLDVIDKIEAVQKGPDMSGQMSVPLEPIRMTVTVKKMSKRSIEKEYDYKYPEKKG